MVSAGRRWAFNGGKSRVRIKVRFGIKFFVSIKGKVVCAWETLEGGNGTEEICSPGASGRPPSNPHPRSAPCSSPATASSLPSSPSSTSDPQFSLCFQPPPSSCLSSIHFHLPSHSKQINNVRHSNHLISRVSLSFLVEHTVANVAYRTQLLYSTSVCIYTDDCTRFQPFAVSVALAVEILNPHHSFPPSCSPNSTKHLTSTILSSNLASSIATRHPSSFSASNTSITSDEEFINRSLLDSVNAQGDSEPPSSSDSEAPGTATTTFGSFSTSSSTGSPSFPFHITMQPQPQSQPHTRSDSPNNVLSTDPQVLFNSADSSTQVAQKSSTIPQMYNSLNSLHLATPDFASLPSSEHDALNFVSPGSNGFGSAAYRNSSAFSLFPTRLQQSTGPYREIGSSFSTSAYPPSSNDIYGTPSHSASVQSPPGISPHTFESVHHPGRAYDYVGVGGPQSAPGAGNGTLQNKSLPFSPTDSYRQGLDSTPSLLQARQAKQQVPVAGGPGILSNAQASQIPALHPQATQYQAPYVNGMSHSISHGHHGAMQSQTQFGSQLASNGAGSVPGTGVHGSVLTGASGLSHVNGNLQNSQQEEISTIFVVGFPDDMQVRVFVLGRFKRTSWI